MADTKTNGTDIHDLADTLWMAADALRSQVAAAEYLHVVVLPRLERGFA